MRWIPFLFSTFISVSLIAQTIERIPLEINLGNYDKIAWVRDGKFCVATDKAPSSDRISHEVSIFDTTGKLIHGPFNFGTRYPTSSEYFFTLGKTCFYVERVKNDMGGNVFYLSGTVTGNGILNDTLREIFYIRSNENKLLSEPSPSFRVFTGRSNIRSILSYNNNYKPPKREGFRFRIIDEEMKLSAEDTLNLPYTDEECNIVDAIYDDSEEVIYFLCNQFSKDSNQKKIFEQSFVASYDLKSKNYQEIKLPRSSFYKKKIQKYSDTQSIAFVGLFLDELFPNPSSASFASITKKPFQLINNNEFILDTGITRVFYNKKNKLNKDYIKSVDFVGTQENLFAGWLKFYTELDNQKDNSRDAIIGSSTALFGAVGFLFSSVATRGMRSMVLGKAISLKYSLITNSIIQDTIQSSVIVRNYYSYSMFKYKDEVFWLMNKPDTSISKASNVFAYQPWENESNNNNIQLMLNQASILGIYPGTKYTNENGSYYIGACYLGNPESMESENFQNCLVKIE